MTTQSPARRLRVLHVITRMIVGGAQETVLLSCALAHRERFDVEALSGVETGSEGELHTEALRRGVHLRFEPSLVRAVDPWRDLTALVRLTRLFLRERPDVVHTHSSKAGILGRVAARIARVPLVVHTVHGWGFTLGQSRPAFETYVALERICARLCDILVVVAEPDRKEGLRRGIGRPEQYRTVRSGIEIAPFRDATDDPAEVRASLGIPKTAFVVGSVLRLSPQKAPLDLLEAFARAFVDRADARLVLVGDGPLRAEVEARAAALGVADRVVLTGLRRDVPRLLRAFDVFALSSRWEGLPRVFPQAMAAGLPIVATRVAGAADAIVDGVTGLLVEPGDIEALSRALLAVSQDDARRRQMGAAGLSRVEEFSAERMVRGLEAIYEAPFP